MRGLPFFFLLVLLMAGFPASAETRPKLTVVASFSILGDMVRALGGERVRVHVLVGPDADAHVYEPVPADARAVAGASLLVLNGLGFEGWMPRLVEASGYRGRRVRAAQGLDTLWDAMGGSTDPHAWQSPRQARLYVRNIAAGLAAADPEGGPGYRRAEAAYLALLDSLDAQLRARLAGIPSRKRLVLTSHDAFGYLARDYGIRFLSPLGWSTDEQPSARRVAALIRQIRKEGVPAAFVENIADPRLMERIAQEAGCRMGGRLYSDALSAPGGPAADFPSLLRHNLAALAGAMEEGAADFRTGR